MRNYFLDIVEEKNKKQQQQKQVDIPSVIVFGDALYPSAIVFDYTITIPTIDLPEDAIQIPIQIPIDVNSKQI